MSGGIDLFAIVEANL